ncbi:hypothetical protein C8R43DRAFT_881412, partial [Mycena crocata]
DVVSITTSDFNSTPGVILPWDSPADFGCEEHLFQLGDSFRTNISAFSYEIFDVESPPGPSGPRAFQGSFRYANNSVLCDITEYQIVVKPGDSDVTSSATILCQPPIGFAAVTTFDYAANYPILGGLPPTSLFGEQSLTRAIWDAMRNVSNDVYWEIANGHYESQPTKGQNTTQKVYRVTADGHPQCATPTLPHSCFIPQPPDTFPTYRAIGNTDLNILPGGPGGIQADVNNLYNAMNVFHSAVRLDLGNWTPDNVSRNNSRGSAKKNSAFYAISQSKGMAYANYEKPPPPSARTSRAFIKGLYTCNVKQRKPLLSFIVNVVSGTVSMFLGTWAVVISSASALARRKPGGTSPVTVR